MRRTCAAERTTVGPVNGTAGNIKKRTTASIERIRHATLRHSQPRSPLGRMVQVVDTPPACRYRSTPPRPAARRLFFLPLLPATMFRPHEEYFRRLFISLYFMMPFERVDAQACRCRLPLMPLCMRCAPRRLYRRWSREDAAAAQRNAHAYYALSCRLPAAVSALQPRRHDFGAFYASPCAPPPAARSHVMLTASRLMP